MIKRIGYACKYVDHNGETVKDLNYKSTTVAWLNRQTRDVATQRLWDIMEHNLSATKLVIAKVGSWVPELRMMRLGSDMLPVYTHADWSWFWQQSAVRDHLERKLAEIGNLARRLDVRLSFHPGQFTVLSSESDDIVRRSIEEFEYHVDMARWMGYGQSWHDHGFKINVHVSGKRGPQGIIDVLPQLSPEARNLITIENEENRWGLDEILALEDHVALVLDVHHHWVNSGEYIKHDDDRVTRVINSWRGVRPVMHYSLSKESELKVMDVEARPDLQKLMESGHKRQKLRAHSDMMWNRAVNAWALGFLDRMDIMTEAKMKNLASHALYQQWVASQS
jgi:UV DNA damage endonuclease